MNPLTFVREVPVFKIFEYEVLTWINISPIDVFVSNYLC